MRKTGIAAITLFLFLFILPISTLAANFHGIEILGEYQLPDNLSIHFSDVCSGHSSFKQAAARDDGWFAVCSLYTNTEENIEQIYSLHYVDIYDSKGNFVEELSFSTDLDNAIELTDDALIIYFQTFVISCDLQSREISSYSIPPRATVENGLLSTLASDSFTSGKWIYHASGGWVNYTKLIRSNDFESQVLIDYRASNLPIATKNIGIYAISAIITGALIVLYFNFYKKRT